MNSVRRSLTSPVRLVSLAFSVLYFWWLIVGRLYVASARAPTLVGSAVKFDLSHVPVVRILDAAFFMMFVLFGLSTGLKSIGVVRATSSADADVLFPTPLPPATVVTYWTLRDALASLVMPLLLLLLTWRSVGLGELFTSLPHPESAGYVLRTFGLAILLLAFCRLPWVSAQYLLTARYAERFPLLPRLVGWLHAGLAVGVLLYVVLRLYGEPTWAGAIAITRAVPLRALFFLPWIGTKLALGPLVSPWDSVWATLALLGIAMASLWVARANAAWAYEPRAAAAQLYARASELRRTGNFTAFRAAQLAGQSRARAYRAGRLSEANLPPWMAIAWRETVQQWRTSRRLLLIGGVVTLIYGIGPILIAQSAGADAAPFVERKFGLILLVMQLTAVAMVALVISGSGYVELLSRVDLLKPLPLAPRRLMLLELTAKALTPTAVGFALALITVFASPANADSALALLFVAGPTACVIAGVTLCATLLFPEAGDGAQRMVRGWIQLLALVFAATPGVVAFTVVYVVASSMALAGLAAGLADVVAVALLALLAGKLFVAFDPRE